MTRTETRRSSPFVAPPVAWPTLALFAVAMTLWLGGIALGAAQLVPAPLATAMGALGAYLAFSPLHEAAHQSISRSDVLNAAIGRLAAIPLMGPFSAVRHFHMEHHRHTNDTSADPDHYSGRGPAW